MNTRIKREWQQIQKSNNDTMSAFPIDKGCRKWNLYIRGSEGTPYVDGIYECSLFISADYPNTAPVLKFKTKIFHPNISTTGKVYIDILQPENWTAVYTINHIMLAVHSMLCCPNEYSMCNDNAMILYHTNPSEYARIASDMRDEFAMKTIINREPQN